MLNSKKLLGMAKDRGVILAEDSIEKGAQGLAHLAVDILEQLVKDTETPLDDMAFMAVQKVARDMADKIEVNF